MFDTIAELYLSIHGREENSGNGELMFCPKSCIAAQSDEQNVDKELSNGVHPGKQLMMNLWAGTVAA